jgi:hypothetical protein
VNDYDRLILSQSLQFVHEEQMMKRFFLIIGILLLSAGFLFLVLAGSVRAGQLAQSGGPCRNCGPVVHIEEGAAVTEKGNGPAILFEKTVGLDPNSCAASGQLTVVSGGDTVYYCYHIENSGDVALTMHTVVDDKLGTLLGPAFPLNLIPGATGFFTIQVNITETTVNSAAWTAFNPGPVDVVTGTDTAEVIVEGPITALTAVNDGPTALGRATTLATIISGGGFETYTWSFGDGDFGTGSPVTHLYPALGVYTAVVTATNAFNSLTATTTVTVIHPPVYMPAAFKP